MSWQLRDANALGMGGACGRRECQDAGPRGDVDSERGKCERRLGQHPNQDVDKHVQVVSDPVNQICPPPYKVNLPRHLVALSSQFQVRTQT